MREFDPQDPFPLWPDYGPALYAMAKKHAAAADAWLGMDVETTESRLVDPRDGEERWIGRHSSIFLTPYVELREMLERIQPKPGETIADLGARYGRLGFVMARHFPECAFRGYEIVPERVRAGAKALQKFGARLATLETADLREIKIPEAQIYFIYDFGSRESVARTLDRLKNAGPIRVVGRGRAVRDAIERHHPWLGSVHEPVHGPHYSLYRSF